MSNPTNESNEAYERRMAIKELMSAPRGTKFQRRAWNSIVWDDCNKPEWGFDEYDYRIAPTPKKVLRPAWEILREAQSAGKVKLYGREVLIVVSNLGFEVALKYIVEAEGADRETVNSEWPNEWFTTEETKQ
jgi:hypothetical protein